MDKLYSANSVANYTIKFIGGENVCRSLIFNLATKSLDVISWIAEIICCNLWASAQQNLLKLNEVPSLWA